MNTMSINTKNREKWKFPENIKFDAISEYLHKFDDINRGNNIVFDLTGTRNLHSSFIGFLIHVKHNLKKRGGNLSLQLSFTVEKILIMLNVMEYFSPDTVTIFNKKSV